MSAAKRTSTAKSAGTKKSASRPAATHPSWIDMIKECIAAHPEEARQGVSRPQIKKFVEDTYNLEIGNAQITQLSKAITSGFDKGVFALPKGLSGRVKLPARVPRPPVEVSATKENKPDSKTSKAPTRAKAPAKSTASKSTVTKKAAAAKKPAAKTTTAKKAAPAKSATKPAATKAKAAPVKKAPAKKAPAAPKKAPAKKAPAPKKTAASSKRDSAKKSVTGKAPAKRPTSRSSATKTSSRSSRAARK